jgi:lysophospholipase L1-like esterase
MQTEISEQLKYSIQFQHPHKVLGLMPGTNESITAQLFELDLATYRTVRNEFADKVRKAADELLEDQMFKKQVQNLPFKTGDVIVGLGDSITDDYQSWIEIIRSLLEKALPEKQLKVINSGISGNTTTEIITRFLAIVQEKPDWIICMAGTNDCRLHGKKPSKTLVSFEETEKNYEMLRNFASTQTEAEWLWLTPPAVIEKQIEEHWFLGSLQLRWRNSDIAKIAELVRKSGDKVADVNKALDINTTPELLLEDGIHPSLEGQKLIAKTVIEALSA